MLILILIIIGHFKSFTKVINSIIDQILPNGISRHLWSSSKIPTRNITSWTIRTMNGQIDKCNWGSNQPVWCVYAVVYVWWYCLLGMMLCLTSMRLKWWHFPCSCNPPPSPLSLSLYLPPPLLPLSLPPSSQCNVTRPPDPLQSHARLLSVSDAKVICWGEVKRACVSRPFLLTFPPTPRLLSSLLWFESNLNRPETCRLS